MSAHASRPVTAVRHPLALAFLLVGARAAAAQFVEFRPQPPAQATGSVPVTIAFGGTVGAYGDCNSRDDYYGCADPYYYAYDDAPPPSALAFMVNGADQTAVLTVSGPADENCWYGSYGTYQCTRTYTATGTAPLQPGQTNELTAAAPAYGLSQTAYVSAGTGPVVTVVSPTLSRDPALCALDCGEVVHDYTMPSYTSLDAPRGLAFVYRSGRARPTPVVEVDVQDTTSSVPPTWVELHLLDPSGAVVPLAHGGQQVLRAYAPGVVNRLAAQFDAGALPMGAHLFTAVVKTFDGNGGAVAEQRRSVRVLVDALNGVGSPYGAGWGVAGLQQLRYQSSDGGVVIVDGGGAMGYWAPGTTVGSTHTFRSPPGDFTTVTFDGNTGSYARRYPDGTTVAFDGWGSEVSHTDRFGNATRFGYNATHLLTSVTDPAQQTTRLYYRGIDEPTYGYRPGSLGDVYDPAGRNTLFGIDSASNDLWWTRNPASQWARRWYDGAHRLGQVQDVRGGVWNYEYDFAGALRVATTPAVTVAGAMRRLSTTQVSWAAAVLPPAGTAAWGGPGAGPAVPAAAERAAITDAQGLTTRYALDGWGAAARVEGPGGVVATAERDANGIVVHAQGQVTSGGTTTTLADLTVRPNAAKPWLVDSTYDAVAQVGTGYSYAANGYDDLQQVRVNGQEQAFYTYDASGRLKTVRRGGTTQPATVYTYGGGAAGIARPTQVADPAGHKTYLGYEAAGLRNLQTTETGPTGPTTVVHDAFGRDSVVTAPLGRRTVTTYDLLNRVLAVTDPAGKTTATTYDDPAGTTTVTDAVGQAYRGGVNALGLPETSTDPQGAVARTAYDGAGRVWSTTNRRGQTVTLGYDPQDGTLTSRSTSDGFTATYGADPLGRWATGANVEARDTVYADAQGRDSVAVRRFAALPALRYTVTSVYDSLGRRTDRTLAREGGSATGRAFRAHVTQYRYDKTPTSPSRGRLESVYTNIEGTYGGTYGGGARFGYNTEGAPSSMSLGNTLTVRNGQTSMHTLGSQRYTQPGGSTALDQAFGYALAYDALGRVTKRMNYNQSFVREFAYDSAGRLKLDDFKRAQQSGCQPVATSGAVAGDDYTNWQCTGPWNSTYPIGYAWDAVGNPVRADVYILPGTGNRMAWANGQNLGYDADGNMWGRIVNGVVAQRLSWNALGQLTGVWNNPQVAGPAGTLTDSVTFGYDAAGQRVRKTNETRGTTTYYLWDGGDLLAELDGAGDLVAQYTHHPETVDAPLFVNVTGPDAQERLYYYVREAPGHVVGLVNDAGGIVAQYGGATGYPAFGGSGYGGPTVDGWTNPLQYGGREYDQETGLYYQRARYYDPRLGRFLSQDPIGLDGGVNLYAYAGGDPVNHRDPSGLARCTSAEEAAGWRTFETHEGPNATPVYTCVHVVNRLGDVTVTASGPSAADMNLVLRDLARMRSAMNQAAVGFGVVAMGPAVAVLGVEAVAGGAGIATLGVARPMIGRTLLPAVASAVTKLQLLGEKFGVSPTVIANRAITQGMRLVDNAEGNAGNINALLPRLDGASGFLRVTLDPTQSRIISAGLQSAAQVANGLKNGRFTPY